MKLNWNFLKGWGVKNKKPSMGGVWIFSGTAHSEQWNLVLVTGSLKINRGQMQCIDDQYSRPVLYDFTSLEC